MLQKEQVNRLLVLMKFSGLYLPAKMLIPKIGDPEFELQYELKESDKKIVYTYQKVWSQISFIVNGFLWINTFLSLVLLLSRGADSDKELTQHVLTLSSDFLRLSIVFHHIFMSQYYAEHLAPLFTMLDHISAQNSPPQAPEESTPAATTLSTRQRLARLPVITMTLLFYVTVTAILTVVSNSAHINSGQYFALHYSGLYYFDGSSTAEPVGRLSKNLAILDMVYKAITFRIILLGHMILVYHISSQIIAGFSRLRQDLALLNFSPPAPTLPVSPAPPPTVAAEMFRRGVKTVQLLQQWWAGGNISLTLNHVNALTRQHLSLYRLVELYSAYYGPHCSLWFLFYIIYQITQINSIAVYVVTSKKSAAGVAAGNLVGPVIIMLVTSCMGYLMSRFLGYLHETNQYLIPRLDRLAAKFSQQSENGDRNVDGTSGTPLFERRANCARPPQIIRQVEFHSGENTRRLTQVDFGPPVYTDSTSPPIDSEPQRVMLYALERLRSQVTDLIVEFNISGAFLMRRSFMIAVQLVLIRYLVIILQTLIASQ